MTHLKKIFFALAAIVVLGWVGADTASAACAASAPAGALGVRQEGTSEVIAPILVVCDATISATPASFISVSINGATLSPAAGDNTDTFTPATGAAANGNILTTPLTTRSSCSGAVTTVSSDTDNFPCPTIAPNINFTSPASPQGAGAGVTTSVGGSTVTFSNITPTVPTGAAPAPAALPAAATNGNLLIVIRNVRINVAASGLQPGAPITATVSFGGGFAVGGIGSPSQIVNIATVVAGLVRTSPGQPDFARSTGTANDLSVVSILACTPARRTPAGAPDTATAVDILGTSLTLGNDRNNNALFTTTAGLWRTQVATATTNGEDPQPGIPTPSLVGAVAGGSGAWSGINLATTVGASTVNTVAPAAIPARTGTRFVVTLKGVPAGINIYVPRSVNTFGPAANLSTITLASTGGNRWTRVTGAESDGSGGGVGADIKDQMDRIATVGDTVTIVYELVESSATPLLFRFPIIYTGVPPTGVSNIDGTSGLAPVGPPTKGVGRPQFTAAPASRRIARTLACVSFLLFPWVAFTGDGAFDTGFAVANTSADPISGTSTTPAVPHSGDVTFNFWRSGGGTNPAPVKVATNLPGGQTATYVLSSLKDPFTGYIIAVCNFEFGHGFAFINSPQPGSGGAFAQGYIALSLPKDRDGTIHPESVGN